MIYGSVCSGIEAVSLAWEPLGFKPAFFSEIDKFPRAVLQHHWPNVPLHGDFTTIGAKDYGSIDIIAGGTPCQSFSVAGLRKGLDDERGNLALEFIKLAKRKQPRWIVWENVPGVLSSNGGRDFGSFIGALVECGYGIAYRVLDAQNFGVPQRRRRVFVVGYLGDWRRAAAVLFERESLSGDIEKGGKAREEVTNKTGGSVKGSHWDDRSNPHPSLSQSHNTGGIGASNQEIFSQRGDGLVATLEASYGRLQGCSGQDLNHGHSHLVIHGTQDPCVSDKAFSLGRNNGGENVVTQFGKLAGTLTARHDSSPCADRGMNVLAVSLRGRDGGATAELSGNKSPCLRASQGGGDKQHILTNVVRRLTPIECERLQGMPDNHTAIPWRNKPAGKCPDGPRYKAIGNSMAVPVLSWIGERLKTVDNS